MNEKPEALRLADELASMWAKDPVVAELRRLHAENEALTATRDRQAAMLRRLEEREAELDAEIGRLRDELRQSSIDHTRAEVERLREALVRYGKHGVDCDAYRGCTCGLDAALRREEA